MKYKNLARIPIERRASITGPKKVFHIYCEGEKTEPNYINSYMQHLGDVPYSLKIVAPVGVAKTVVSVAVRDKDALSKTAFDDAVSLTDTDEFWVVFDCDEEERHYAEAVKHATATGIQLGCSNPCFELWLIMHFEIFDSPDSHKALQQRVRRFCSGYHPVKSKTVDFNLLKDRVAQAELRAKQLRRLRARDGATRPETTFDLLTTALREASQPIKHGKPTELEGIRLFQKPSRRHTKSSRPKSSS